MMPLRRLLAGNLREAHKLGMIECAIEDIEDCIALVEASWDSTNVKEFKQWMEKIGNKFHKQFRPIQAFKGKSIPFCNIMRLGIFSKYWLETGAVEPSPDDQDAILAKERIVKLAEETNPVSKDSQDQLEGDFVRLNQWIKKHEGGRKQGVLIELGPFLERADRLFWIGGRVNKPDISAQYWRDRLGLIHFSENTQLPQELLVRLRFTAIMANSVLPRNEYLEHRRNHPNQMWVFRPSIVHNGNKRFVQGVSADRISRPAHRGSTRDISSIHYLEGERELILLTGELANARLIGIDLLNGFAHKINKFEDDDNSFVDTIAHHRGWAP